MRRFTPYSKINLQSNYSEEKGMISNGNNYAFGGSWRLMSWLRSAAEADSPPCYTLQLIRDNCSFPS